MGVVSEVGVVRSLSYLASSLRARASSSLSCTSTGDRVGARETGFGLRGFAFHGFAEEDEGMGSLSTTNRAGRNFWGAGRGAGSRSDRSNARARSSSWERSELACSLSVRTDNSRASSSSSSSFIPSESPTGGFADGKVSGAVSLVSGAFAMRLGFALGESLGCGTGLRIAVSEGERAPRGFGGSIGGGGSGGTYRGGAALCDIGEGGWDLDRGTGGRSTAGGTGMNGGGLGGNVGVIVGGIITGVFGGRGGTTGCGSSDCGNDGSGNGSGGGGGWTS